jgi:NADH-quinone oxidoreductase subunit L
MITGALTLLFAVMMALVQTDYKRLLAYHAVSQVGYMILGIGTAMPAGIIGGIFHMVNHALYKSCLFLTAGAVERQAGTTDIKKLGGLSGKMPLTFTCFFVAAAAISGVPPFNGFFSKELVYEGALERSWVFYAAALLGSFLTAASFLKLGHAVYLGRPPEGQKQVMEAPASMLAPMAVLASLCIMFGLYNVLPIQGMIQPILGEHRLEGHSYGGLPSSAMLVLMTLAALAGAYLNHLYGVEKSGRAYGAADHIHNAPGLSVIYEKAGRRCFDPYDQGMKLLEAFAKAMYSLDRAVDWLYGVMSVRAAQIAGGWIRTCHTGSYALYIIWSLLGTAAVILIALAHGN